MRPTTEWVEAEQEAAGVLQRHGVRLKRVRRGLERVYLVPEWAGIFYEKYMRRRAFASHYGQLRRALRRAARDPEFREAFNAAALVNMELEFLRSQEQHLDD